ncbi:MAG TPA: hypothetical protein VN776_09065 [Terracidiphilus sp.]|nr:hypothetical protein [Terracidiphilus sp.]
MKQLWLIPIGFVALAVPAAVLAGSGQTGFDGVVSSIESRYHVHATRIPFLGLISLVSKKATHGGVGGLHVAEFDSFTEQVDGAELNHIVSGKLGSGWERLIRETSKKGHEQTLVFTHPEGDRMALFVVDLDGNEMDVVQVSVNPNHLDDDIGHYSHHHQDKDADKDTDKDTDNDDNQSD